MKTCDLANMLGMFDCSLDTLIGHLDEGRQDLVRKSAFSMKRSIHRIMGIENEDEKTVSPRGKPPHGAIV